MQLNRIIKARRCIKVNNASCLCTIRFLTYYPFIRVDISIQRVSFFFDYLLKKSIHIDWCYFHDQIITCCE
jgi:hypothetical protein